MKHRYRKFKECKEDWYGNPWLNGDSNEYFFLQIKKEKFVRVVWAIEFNSGFYKIFFSFYRILLSSFEYSRIEITSLNKILTKSMGKIK